MRRFLLITSLFVLAVTAVGHLHANGAVSVFWPEAKASSSAYSPRRLRDDRGAVRSSSVSAQTRSSKSSAASQAASSALPPDPARLATLKVPILVYHHIRETKAYPKSTWSWKMSVAPSIFEQHMQWIQDHGYTAVDLNTLVAIFRGEIRGPEKPIVITFDDNNLTQYDIALPVLEKHHQIGVFYLITQHLTNKGMIDAERAKDLHKRGQDVESHTITHRVLTALPGGDIDRELRESKKVLEDLLGKQVLHVAYPGTAHNATVREKTEADGYVTGTIMDPRPATAQDSLYKLPRIMMTDDTNLAKTLP